MKITYNKFKKTVESQERLGFLLNSLNGNFLNLGVEENFTKFNGYFFGDLDNNEFYKILDEIIPSCASEVENVIDNGCVITKVHKGYLENIAYNNPNYEDDNVDNYLYLENKDNSTTQDFFVGLSGGLIYEIKNYYGDLIFDFDIRKKYDFDDWGRNYNVYQESDLVYIEYEKNSKDDNNNENNGENKNYKICVCLKVPNTNIQILNDFIEKDYKYDKERNTNSKRYVFRAFKFEVSDNKKIFMGVGFSKEEAYKELMLLENHSIEMRNIEQSYQTSIINENNFKKPISHSDYIAYHVGFKNYFKFFARDFVTDADYTFAGFPWFFQDWSRDHLVGLKPMINSQQLSKVKQTLFDYLKTIDSQNPFLGVFKGAKSFSLDGTFWLFLRFSELFEKAEKLGEFDNLFHKDELDYIVEKGYFILENITLDRFDKEKDLINPIWAETWMDTIERNYPVEIQAMFLKFLNFMSSLSKRLNNNEDFEKYKDLENYLSKIVKQNYFKDNNLYDELDSKKIRVNVFLVYYFYPQLLSSQEWEDVFDNSIRNLWLDWGGFSSLSKFDNEFENTYTGENNLSYHRGDSWFFMNNIGAICLYSLNYKKYKDYVHKILLTSKKELLERGFIGFISEVSDAKEFSSKGCLAQFWSQATFIEFLDLFYERK